MRLTARAKTLLQPSRVPWRRVRTIALDPFRFQKVRGGLTWGTGQVTLTLSGRTRARVQVLDTITVPLQDASTEALTAAFTRLRDQYPGYLPPVILGLDSTIMSYQLLVPPDPLPVDLPAWIVSHASQFIPPGVRLAEITLDFRVVRGANRPFIQAVWARRARLDSLVVGVETAGFRVVGVYPQAMAAVECVSEVSETTAHLVLCQPEAVTFVPLTEKLPQCLHEVAWAGTNAPMDWSRLAERIQRLFPAPSRSVTLVVASSRDSTAPGVALAAALEQQDVSITTMTGPAEAEALAQVGLDTARTPFQLGSARAREWAHQDQDRCWTLRIGWSGGFLIVLLLVVGLILHRSYAQRQQVLTADLAITGVRLAQVRALAATEQTLLADMAALRTLQADRTGVGALLETLGRTVPEHLWLRALRVERQAEAGRYRIQFIGLARTEAALTAFLSGLEAQAGWRPSGVVTTARVDAEMVHQQTGIRTPLIRFELACVVTQ